MSKITFFTSDTNAIEEKKNINFHCKKQYQMIKSNMTQYW